MTKKSEVEDNSVKFGSEIELNEELKVTVQEYSKGAKLIIKRLEDRRTVSIEFLSEIDTFIEYAKKQVENKDISEEIRIKYLDLIEEEESLRDRILEDLKRNDKLIKSIKKSTNALFR